MNTEELYNKTTEELYDKIVETLSSGNFLTLNGKPINLSELSDYINAQQQEIERLNNIINELEKYINGRIEYCYNNGTYQDVFDVYNEIDMKLQELKGSDKE